MLILPAVDLLGGSCVRLRRGEYDRVTHVSADPLAVARSFARQGATALHVVDLDGARAGRPIHRELIVSLSRASGLALQVGGGIRRRREVAGYLEDGVERVVLGTSAVDRPGWLAAVVREFGAERVVGACDVRDGRVRVAGWRRPTPLSVEGCLERLGSAGVTTVLYTDIERDGTRQGPNRAGARRAVEAGFRTIVAGGIAAPSQLRSLRELGAWAAVVGRALYDGTLGLTEALATSRAEPAAPAGTADREGAGEEEGEDAP
ncbi:MAG: HisA/HisF-related TIM barrel protein [Gemmatimonadota bacterium]